MTRGGRKTPTNNRSPIVTRSHSDPTIILDLATMSEATPDSIVELVTPIPEGFNVHEIIYNSRQSILTTQGALSRLRKTSRQLNQCLDFSNQQEDPLATGLLDHSLGYSITDPFEALIQGSRGSGLPPSPLGSSPPSSREESYDEGSSSTQQSQNPLP
jgi:hypothetical protein